MNNAGLSRGKLVAEGTYHDNSITLRTNLLAPFLLLKEFLPYMVQKNHGHIVNVSSLSAYIPPAGLADYAASKAGLIALHEVNPFFPYVISHIGPTIPLTNSLYTCKSPLG